MCRADHVKKLALAAMFAATGGCASHPAPPKWLPDARQAANSAWGGWIRLQVRTDSARTIVGGELIAAHDDTVFVMAPGDSLRAIPHAAIWKAELVQFDPKQGHVSMLAFLGVLSTASHGVALLLTAPAWMITGASVTHVVVNEAMTKSTAVKALRPHARFPQGIPSTLDRATLLPKPFEVKPVQRRYW